VGVLPVVEAELEATSAEDRANKCLGIRDVMQLEWHESPARIVDTAQVGAIWFRSSRRLRSWHPLSVLVASRLVPYKQEVAGSSPAPHTLRSGTSAAARFTGNPVSREPLALFKRFPRGC
jgi:hypothetical protein